MWNQSTTLWCIFWFVSNFSITFYNKYILSSLDISPSQNTLAHMVFTFVGCFIICKGEIPKLKVSEWQQMFIFSFIFAFNVVYSQLGMKETTLSLNQVMRAVTPLYQLALEYLMMSRPYWKESAIALLPVCLGIILTSLGEMELTLFGLIVSVTSVFVSALKGVLSMKILQKDLKSKLQEYSFLLIVTPMATFWIVAMEFVVEMFNRNFGSDAVANSLNNLGSGNAVNANISADTKTNAIINNNDNNSSVIYDSWMWYALFLGGALAFLTNVASIGTVKRTSASAMGVMANVKQALTIFLAMFVTENSWTVMKLLGSIITVIGAVWYSYQQEILNQKEKAKEPKVEKPQESNKKDNDLTEIAVK